VTVVKVGSTRAEVDSIMAAVVIILVEDELPMPCAAERGKVLAVEDKVSMVDVDIKVHLLLVAILFRVSPVGQPEEEIIQTLGMTIGEEIGTTITTTTVIRGLVLGIINSVGQFRTMEEEGALLSQGFEGMLMGRRLEVLLMPICYTKLSRQLWLQ
jgi:hypothetical protein